MGILAAALKIKNMVTPAAPAAGVTALYTKDDGNLYRKNVDNIERAAGVAVLGTRAHTDKPSSFPVGSSTFETSATGWPEQYGTVEVTVHNINRATQVYTSKAGRKWSRTADNDNWTAWRELTPNGDSHNHDNRYYTESEINTLLGAKTDRYRFSPGNPGGGNRSWVRILTIDGLGVNSGGYAQFALAGTGDYGSARRGLTFVTCGQRGADSFNIDTWAMGTSSTADPIEFYSVQVGTYKFEVWGKFADYNQTQDLHLLASQNTVINLDQIGTTAPANPVKYDVRDVMVQGQTVRMADLPVAASGASSSTALVRADDPRLSNSRVPTGHSHGISDLPVAPTGQVSSTALVRADDTRLSDARTPKAHSHSIADLPAAAHNEVSSTKFVRADDPRLVNSGGGSQSPLPTGTILDYAGKWNSVPAGFLPCDGRAVSRSTYANLFAVLGTFHGAGDGSTTFNVPDLGGRFTMGVTEFDAGDFLVGIQGGASEVTLTKENLPPHVHTMNHNHTINARTGAATGANPGHVNASGGTQNPIESTAPNAFNGNTGNGSTDGLSATPVDIMPPYSMVYKIIKT